MCEEIAKEGQRIQIRKVKRRYGKIATIIEGIDERDVNLKDVAKKLKTEFACGGTVKKGIIELQGDYGNKVKEQLVGLGFSAEMIEG